MKCKLCKTRDVSRLYTRNQFCIPCGNYITHVYDIVDRCRDYISVFSPKAKTSLENLLYILSKTHPMYPILSIFYEDLDVETNDFAHIDKMKAYYNKYQYIIQDFLDTLFLTRAEFS